MGNQEEQTTFDDRAPQATLHLYFALMRKKENPGVTKPLVMRQIIHSRVTDLAMLEARIRSVPGIWRIYETLNARDVKKARKALMIELIKDERGKYDDRIDSLWKTCLMQESNKAEHNLLLDLDTQDPEIVGRVVRILEWNGVHFQRRPTVNRWHFKTDIFDTRLVAEIPALEIKHDALFFIKTIDTRPVSTNFEDLLLTDDPTEWVDPQF